MSRSFTFFIAILFLILSAAAQDPSRTATLNERGLKLYKAGKFQAALDAFSEAIQVSSSLVRKREMPGNSLAERDQAVQTVSAIDPRTAAALVNRGNVYFMMGDFESALSDYDRALRISPGLAEGYSCRAAVFLYRGEVDRAIEEFSRSIKIDPKFVKGYLGRGLAYVTKGNVNAAFADFDAAGKLDPNNAEIYYRRGDARRISGDDAASGRCPSGPA